MSGVTFVSLLLVEILFGEGGQARCLLTITTTNSHIFSLFWPYFTEWCFSFFFEGGGEGVCFNSTIQGAGIIYYFMVLAL